MGEQRGVVAEEVLAVDKEIVVVDGDDDLGAALVGVEDGDVAPLRGGTRRAAGLAEATCRDVSHQLG